MTTAIHSPPVAARSWRETTRAVRGRHSAALGTTGLLLLLAGAWGGIVPFVGPLFNFSATGTPAWHWSLSHALLGLVPGAVACFVGLTLMVPRVSTVAWRRLGLTAAGVTAIAAGAWFVIGPAAWPVVSSGPYFVPADPLTELEYQLAYSLGPGLIVAACGGVALGWALRHRSPLRSPDGVAVAGDPAYSAAPDATRPPAGERVPTATVRPTEPAQPVARPAATADRPVGETPVGVTGDEDGPSGRRTGDARRMVRRGTGTTT